VADEHYSLTALLSAQQYLNKHPKVPRDFAILPFCILKHHVDETLTAVQDLTRLITSAEKRIAEGVISLDDNGDYKLINRLNLEHVRLQRRSDFQLDLASNLLKYLDAYQRLWSVLFEGGTGYIEDMREKTEQQMRYSIQVQKDLEMLPRRIDNQSKAVGLSIALYETNADNVTDVQHCCSPRQQAEHTAGRKLSSNCRRKSLRQLVECQARKSDSAISRRDSAGQCRNEDHRRFDTHVPSGDSCRSKSASNPP
jgi:hypothetical protein